MTVPVAIEDAIADGAERRGGGERQAADAPFANLNAAQRTAVLHGDGPLLVAADDHHAGPRRGG